MEHVATQSHVPVGFWRSVGHSHNAFFAESFMDELALKAGADPVAFRELDGELRVVLATKNELETRWLEVADAAG